MLTGILIAAVVALSGMLIVAAPGRAGAATSGTSDVWATVAAADQKLRGGCRAYAFDYDVDVPGDEWMVELTLVGPRRSRLGTKTFESAAQRPSGRGAFQVCRTHTVPGVHEIRVKVTSYDGRDVDERWMAPTRFRIRG